MGGADEKSKGKIGFWLSFWLQENMNEIKGRAGWEEAGKK